MIQLMTARDPRPTLETERLLLRPFQRNDAAEVRRLVGDIRVARNLSLVPHPYPEGLAETWIEGQRAAYEAGTHLTFAITLKGTGAVMGAISLHPKEDLLRAEVGYWVGVPFWGKGYTTEALEEMLRFGFDDFALQRIFATHFVNNPASGRVMEKVGMTLEGVMKLGISRFGVLSDSMQRAIIKPDWERRRQAEELYC
ncbi:GNAT family N-acetyltransferase [Roseibacillus persicicus]|nr:GNAT family N-acetyltransferase [Roseibacillus persicicus]